MKIGIAVFSILTFVGSSCAVDLSFTLGSVTNFSTVNLLLSGPTNSFVFVERLNRTNQSWEVISTNYLSNGVASATSSLHSGAYGFFRARATNNTFYSTNAYGAVVGALPSGYGIFGNPFAGQTLTSIFPVSPGDGTFLHLWNNSTTNYDSTEYFGGWSSNFTVGRLEGAVVFNASTNSLSYVVSGLFTTNAIAKSIPKGLSIVASPLYLLQSPTNWQIDTLTTNQVGGASLIPVQTAGANPQCTVSKMIDSSGNYRNYTLSTNRIWQLGTTNTTVPIYLSEGFWINKPLTNATWSIGVPIW